MEQLTEKLDKRNDESKRKKSLLPDEERNREKIIRLKYLLQLILSIN